MRIEDLPAPGPFSGSQKLRQETCKAISFIEISAAYKGGSTAQAEQLYEFFVEAAKKVKPLIPKKTKEKRDENT